MIEQRTVNTFPLIRHIKSGALYTLLGKHKYKINGEWVESYMYTREGQEGYYGRPKKGFWSKFEKVV